MGAFSSLKMFCPLYISVFLYEKINYIILKHIFIYIYTIIFIILKCVRASNHNNSQKQVFEKRFSHVFKHELAVKGGTTGRPGSEAVRQPQTMTPPPQAFVVTFLLSYALLILRNVKRCTFE